MGRSSYECGNASQIILNGNVNKLQLLHTKHFRWAIISVWRIQVDIMLNFAAHQIGKWLSDRISILFVANDIWIRVKLYN